MPTKVFNARAIRIWLAERDMNQYQLAEKANISEMTLSQIMNGKRVPNLGTLDALSFVTKLPIECLWLIPTDTEFAPPAA